MRIHVYANVLLVREIYHFELHTFISVEQSQLKHALSLDNI